MGPGAKFHCWKNTPVLAFKKKTAITASFNSRKKYYTVNTSKSLFLTTTSLLTLLLPLKAANYYVSTGGDDSSPGTAATTPYRTIQKAASTAVSGDTVTVAGGYYNETVTLDGNGTPDLPIIFLGTGLTVLVGNLYIDGTGLIVNGFTVSPPTAGGTSAISLGGANNQLVNCTVVNYGAVAYDQATAISIAGSFNLVNGCTVHDLNDIDVFHVFGHDNTIFACTVYNIQSLNYTENHTDIFQSWNIGGIQTYNIVVDSCTVTNCSCQLGNTETSNAFNLHDWTFRNNVFANITSAFFSGIPRTLFYNNLFDRVGTGLGYAVSLYGDGATYDSDGDEFINNVFLNSGEDIHIHDGGAPEPLNQNNRFSNQGGNYNFVNQGAFNYHLLPGSVLLGAGANLHSLFTQDKDGNPYPASGIWTIGPYSGITVN
jgi:hypothetical protein